MSVDLAVTVIHVDNVVSRQVIYSPYRSLEINKFIINSAASCAVSVASAEGKDRVCPGYRDEKNIHFCIETPSLFQTNVNKYHRRTRCKEIHHVDSFVLELPCLQIDSGSLFISERFYNACRNVSPIIYM
jgi:hypothetical protein